MNPHIAHDRNLSAEFHAAIAETVRFDKRVEEVTAHLFDVMSTDLKRGIICNTTKDVVNELAGEMTASVMAPIFGFLLSGHDKEAAAAMKVLLCKALLKVADMEAIVDTERSDS